jgi:cold shock CspA family protein
MAETGVVVFYDKKNNYGFIEPDDESSDLTFSLAPGEGPIQVGDNVIFERMHTPYITPIGPTAYRVRRAGFAPVKPHTEAEPDPAQEADISTTP